MASKKLENAAKTINFQKEDIEDYLNKWKTCEELCEPERILNDLFAHDNNPINIDKTLDKEFVKLCVLNQVYSTRISTKDLLLIAKYLSDSEEIRSLINSGDAKAVGEIALSAKNQDTHSQRCYVFATKYCSFAAPEDRKNEYPIHDGYVGIAYKYMKTSKDISDKIFEVASMDENGYTENYISYKKAVNEVFEALKDKGIRNVKEMDQCVWLAMREKLAKK